MRCPRTGGLGQGQHLLWRRISLCEIRPPIPPKKRAVRARAWRKEGVGGEEFRHARAVAKRFRRPAIGGTSKQNNFQILLRKIWRAGVKKLKENCFALLAEVRRAETRSGVNQAFFVQNRFELRSAIATSFSVVGGCRGPRHFIFIKIFLLTGLSAAFDVVKCQPPCRQAGIWPHESCDDLRVLLQYIYASDKIFF